MGELKCYHCGNEVTKFNRVLFDEKAFCCKGCKTVYEIFSENDLGSYYDFQSAPGATPELTTAKYDFLDNSDIRSKLLDFEDDNIAVVTLYIPHIHCSSCIWILENLQKLNSGIIRSTVNFPIKKVSITFNTAEISLREIAGLLSKIGYSPYISLENFDVKKQGVDRSLVYKIGIAFFSFGNVMMLSFPEYFNIDDYWINEYREFFRWLILLLSLPVFFYSASGYYIAAWKGIRSKMYTIDIPMALGIIVMFLRSLVDIVFGHGQGFLDSMCALVFFMLLGKLFQQRTYNFLSFERDYKSYFPIAVTKLHSDKTETAVQIYEVQRGDRLLIRNQELLPVDGILISERAFIDYSFVTGEAVPVEKKSGDKLFAGGKQVGELVEIEVVNSVSQSYLTQLWSNDVFQKKVDIKYRTITDQISHYFTPALIALSIIAFIYWAFIDLNAAFNVFTAILIVACPCALALTAPFTLGNVIRIMGRKKFYLKNVTVVEQMAKVDTLVFDKTGTLTTQIASQIRYEGTALTEAEKSAIKNIIRGSNHPLSRRLYSFLPQGVATAVRDFEEKTGAGLQAVVDGLVYKIGSAKFLGTAPAVENEETVVYIQIGGFDKGRFVFENQYRSGLEKLFSDLADKGYGLHVLSGDNEGEQEYLKNVLPPTTNLVFNQKPEQKLAYINELQQGGNNVMMVGDGLNDAGALAQSNVGVSIAENVNVFTPASDAILDASQFEKINYFLKYSKNAVKTIKMSYVLALTYNVIGLSFAVSNHLSPLVAAILMPISTASMISFVTIMSNYYSRKKN
ncbi:heavy metal translocating P-type ATPase [Flavobacterium sp. JP2137]|uniref:heavy metal translocating P-type ATPase n=1 Tax=Flavobacterium sp. JP2137 TaxID=3414510 RepID=UPI003D2FEC9A